MKIKKTFMILVGSLLLAPLAAQAHEAYVLPNDFFWGQMKGPTDMRSFTSLQNPDDLKTALIITGCVLLAIFLNFLFRRAKFVVNIHDHLEKFSYFGAFFIRVSLAASFFFGAKSGAFLGPELPIAQMPMAELMQSGLYLSSLMILFGAFTEVAALIGFIIFTVGFFAYGSYLITYLNYLGELLVLLVFGSRQWSFDGFVFGHLKKWRHKWEPYETTIIRVFYGFSLIYAAITVKLLHTDITLRVIGDWSLNEYNWLFPSSPLLIVLGAGLAEAVLGLLILLGFELRMSILISLFYITLSLFYFRELVWPHILLYGISLNLMVQPEILTLDHFFFKKERGEKPIWKRLFSSHRKRRELPQTVNKA